MGTLHACTRFQQSTSRLLSGVVGCSHSQILAEISAAVHALECQQRMIALRLVCWYASLHATKICYWCPSAAAAGTRKLEIFARQHNVRPGWVSLGNQLDGTWLTDPELAARYAQRYGPAERPKRPPPKRMTAPEYSAHFAREYGGDWTFGRHV
jgi:mRNA (2'-O-methyladenosine-N6-)-methyltransferase